MSLLWHEKAPNTRPEELLWALWMRDWETNCWLIAQLSCFTAKGLKSLQLLSKSREVLLKNAEHKITNKLQAVMLFLFFSKHALYKSIESICYNNWVVLAGQIFQRTTMKLKRTECLLFDCLRYDCPPGVHPRLHVCTPVLQRSSTICQKAHYQVSRHNLTYIS